MNRLDKLHNNLEESLKNRCYRAVSIRKLTSYGKKTNPDFVNWIKEKGLYKTLPPVVKSTEGNRIFGPDKLMKVMKYYLDTALDLTRDTTQEVRVPYFGTFQRLQLSVDSAMRSDAKHIMMGNLEPYDYMSPRVKYVLNFTLNDRYFHATLNNMLSFSPGVDTFKELNKMREIHPNGKFYIEWKR